MIRQTMKLFGFFSKKQKKEKSYNKWLQTFTKRSVAVILFFSILDLQLSYILAFMGKDQIAESLSSTIASTVIGVMIGYFLKSLFETFFEKREERIQRQEQNLNESEEDNFGG